jgi:hypothetical protein
MGINSLVGMLFPQHESVLEIRRAIENNQPFQSKCLEIKPTPSGPEIWLKAQNEDEIISAARELTKVYKQNPELKSKIYSGLKIDFPSSYYKNIFGDFGYKGESEEIKDKAASEIIKAIQASEAIVPTPSENGEISFGHNPVADALNCVLSYLHAKRFPEMTIEIKNEKKKNSAKKHRKALAALAALGFGSCIAYPSIVKEELTFDPSLIINHLSKIGPYIFNNINSSLYSAILLTRVNYDFEQKGFLRRNWKKILIPCFGLGALSFYLDASSQSINLPILNIKIPGLLNAIKAISYLNSTSLDWNRCVNLALHTDTLNFLSGILGRETELSKAISIYKQLEGEKDSNVYGLLKLFLEDGKISQDEARAASIYKQLEGAKDQNVYNLLKFSLEDGKISEEEIQTAYTYKQLYKQLNADKDSKAYDLLRLFLEDGKISQDEITAASYYSRVRDKLIPENLLAFWPLDERSYLAYVFCKQLLLDGKITEEEKRIAELMLNFRKPMTTVWGIKKGIILDVYKDHDNDGFSTYEELLAGKNYLNPLETPLTNDSEVYIITVSGSGGGYYNLSLEAHLILRYYALKYGIPEDHIITFAKYRQAGACWQGDPLERLSPLRREFFSEINGHLLKDYPLKIDYEDENCTKANLIKEIKRILQLADSNDVVYIHNFGEGPGFKLFYGPNNTDYEMLHVSEMVEIMKSTPRQGKLILVNDTCGGEMYIRALKEAMIREGSPLKDYVGIGAVRDLPNQPGETSAGTFDFIFLSKLRDGYSIKDAVPPEFRDYDEDIKHPVIILGEGNYDWIKYYNLFY